MIFCGQLYGGTEVRLVPKINLPEMKQRLHRRSETRGAPFNLNRGHRTSSVARRLSVRRDNRKVTIRKLEKRLAVGEALVRAVTPAA